MRQSLALGGILGGLVLFVWGTVSWMVLPWHLMTLQKFTDEAAVAGILSLTAPQAGVYILPNPHKHDPGLTQEQKKAAEEEGHRRMMRGPFMFASVSLSGVRDLKSALVTSLLGNILAALLATWLLLKTSGLGYLGRAGFLVLVAMTAAVIDYLPNWTWWTFSTSYTAVAFADLLIGWLLAGLVMAKVVGSDR
jgi:hypothetical protein